MGISASLGSSALLPAGLGFRNLLINGAMQIAQRNTSVASITTSGYYTADRWKNAISSFGTWTQSVENDAPTGSGFRKSLKMLCSTADASPAASDSIQFAQLIEGQNLQAIKKGTASAQTLLLSFWVKSNITGTYVCEAYDIDNGRQVSKTYSIDAINTWEYKTISLPADAAGAFDNDSSASVAINWWLGSGTTFTSGTLNTLWGTNVSANRAVGQVNLAAATNNYWQITGVQLEANLQPTPFEHRPIGVELALCQRYYQLWRGSTGTGYNFAGSGHGYNSTSVYPTVILRQQMRAIPTTLEYNSIALNDASASYNITALAYDTATIDTVRLHASIASGGVQYRVYLIGSINSTSSYLAIGAEL